MYVVPLLPHKRKIDGPRQNNVGKFQLSFAINLARPDSINFCVEKSHLTVVGFKLSGPFKFFFDIINVRVTFLDVKGPIK